MLPQLPHFISRGLSNFPDPVQLVLVFFTYSLLGFVLECIVLSVEKRRLVTNRGFANHLPFCVIYGFGATLGYAVLNPLAGRPLVLFLVGALGATLFEYLVARLQMRLFGDFWWDYSEKRMNYQGIVCLESTVGWGLAALLVIHVGHGAVVGLVSRIPADVAKVLAPVLVLAYIADFVVSARRAAERGSIYDDESRALQADEAYVPTMDGRGPKL